MNRRSLVVLLAGVLGIALVGYALFGRPTDEERVAAVLDRLEEALSLDGQTTNPLFLKSRFDEHFDDIFDRDVTYSIPELSSGASGRASLSRLAVQSAVYYRTLRVDLTRRDIRITAGGRLATVDATAVLTASRSGELRRDERRVHFDLTDGDDGYRIDSVRVFPPHGSDDVTPGE